MTMESSNVVNMKGSSSSSVIQFNHHDHDDDDDDDGDNDLMMTCLERGISSLLSRWNALQLAITNEWGGPDSLQKSHLLAAEILSCLFHSKAGGQVCVEDIETLLHENLLLSFNTDIEDGSIELVAEKLMILHEEYLQPNF